MSSRSSTSTPLSQDYYFYLFYEQIGQGLEERLEPAPTSSNDEAHQTLRYSPASTDESNGQRSDKCHAIHRKPVAIASMLVSWNGPQDSQNPMNWSSRRKTLIVAAICCISFSISFSGGLFAPAALTVAAEFGVNEEVALLGVSLYVLGFAAGPLLWGPLSEAYGRTQPLFFAYGFFVIMQVPIAVAQNLTAVLLCRFLVGALGSVVIAVPPALVVDFLNPVERSKAVCLYVTFLFFGAPIAPVVGAYLTTLLGWRWTGWAGVLVGVLSGTFALLVIPESSEAVILQRKAARLRPQTQNWALHSKLDENPVTFASLRKKYFLRPIQMILREPILIVMTIYTSLAYGVLYLIFFVYPYSFQEVRGWSLETASLPFLAVAAGVLFAGLAMAIFNKLWWLPRFLRNRMKVNPEDRIFPLIASSIILPTGLFWFAWTSNKNTTWVPQVLAGIFIGAGIMLPFLSGTAYLIDVYLLNANSALAANICIRSMSAAVFPLFGKPMYERLGVAWATSLLAFFCVALIPFPIVLWRYGGKIRGWSKYSFEL